MVDTKTASLEEFIEILSRQRDANLGRAVRQERRHRRHAVASPARRRGRIERAFNRRRRQNEENSRRDGKSGRVCHRSLFYAESVQKARTGRRRLERRRQRQFDRKDRETDVRPRRERRVGREGNRAEHREKVGIESRKWWKRRVGEESKGRIGDV